MYQNALSGETPLTLNLKTVFSALGFWYITKSEKKKILIKYSNLMKSMHSPYSVKVGPD
jgi:hypothetical protein